MNIKLACFLTITQLFVSTCFAQKPDPWSVRAMIPSCESLPAKLSGKSAGGLTFDEGRCLGVVVSAMQFGSTMLSTDKKSCPPSPFETGQVIVDVLFHIKYQLIMASDKASLLDTSFAVATAAALSATYPCKRS